MGLGENLKKLVKPARDEQPERANGTTRTKARSHIEPLSDEERVRVIEEARLDLPELDAKVEKNLDRLRDLSRS